MTEKIEEIGEERLEFGIFMVLKSIQGSFNFWHKCRKPIKKAPRIIICQWISRWNSLGWWSIQVKFGEQEANT